MKTYEKELPAEYVEVGRVDATDKNFATKLTIASFVLLLPFAIWVGVLCGLGQKRGTLDLKALWDGSWIPLLAIVLYLVAHELTHGIAYKLMTGEKLTFGLTLTVAYCGVPDIYVYRRTALISLLAPFVLFSVIFGGLTIFTTGIQHIYWLVVFGVHFSGCAGDLYDTWLFLTKYRDESTLMRDSGPTQWFYQKQSI